ncbi:MAG: nucleotidyltransferase domain-containing protein [Deltaproteobacteria bacterium]|nr:nucleotidyltransferase domain-containing protein [Deltaproteobacteria bacterium]
MIGGIADEHWQRIVAVFRKHPNITDVILYGSRAKGNFREGSDIDLAVKGTNIQSEQLTQIDMDYEDLYLPWQFDVRLYDTIRNEALKAHIDHVGISLLALPCG